MGCLDGPVEMAPEQWWEAVQLSVDRYTAVLREWWHAGTVGNDPDAAWVILQTLAQLDELQGNGEFDV